MCRVLSICCVFHVSVCCVCMSLCLYLLLNCVISPHLTLYLYIYLSTNIQGGSAEDFFFRHPLPEHVVESVTSPKKKKEEGVMAKAWKEVSRTRSITSHVHNLVASPPLSGAGRIGSLVKTTDVKVDGWEVTAREVKLEKNRLRFESGYLFKPERETTVESDPSKSVENESATSASSLINRTKTSKGDKGNVMTQMLPPNDSSKIRRMLYVLRSRIENMRDPSIKSGYSTYLLCEAPHVFSEVAVRIPKPNPRPFSDAFTIHADDSHSASTKTRNKETSVNKDETFNSFMSEMKSLVNQSSHMKSGGSSVNNETVLSSTHKEEVREEEELERLAADWVEHWDEKLKRPYFQHLPTHTVQWSPPTHWHGIALS